MEEGNEEKETKDATCREKLEKSLKSILVPSHLKSNWLKNSIENTTQSKILSERDQDGEALVVLKYQV